MASAASSRFEHIARRQEHESAETRLDRALLQTIDVCLAGVIFLTPFMMGGRHAIGQLALTVLAVLAGCAWATRQSIGAQPVFRAYAALTLLATGAMLVFLQTLWLPSAVFERLMPRNLELLPLWRATNSGSQGLGDWGRISLLPAETKAALVLLLDYGLLFFVAVQRIRRIDDVERLLCWCAISAVVMAIFGIVQLFAGNGKFFWFYEHPFSNTYNAAKGSFSNRNHFASFLALGIGPLIWWMWEAVQSKCTRTRETVHFLGIALVVVVFAGLLSLSRGGIAALFIAAAVPAVVGCRTSAVGARFVVILGVVAVVTWTALNIFGIDRVSSRLDDYTAGSLERLDQNAGRRTIWAAAAKAVGDRPWLGAGAGSFAQVYPLYIATGVDEDLEYTHAENCSLQIAVETGLAGLALVFCGIGMCGYWCAGGLSAVSPPRIRLCTAAIAGSLTANVVHAQVDFIWYVPACMSIASILAACALRLHQFADNATSKSYPIPNSQSSMTIHSRQASLAWTAVAAVVLLVGGWMIADRVGPAIAQPYWDQYLAARHAAQLRLRDGKESTLNDLAVQQRWIGLLNRVVYWQPLHDRAHLALAETHRRLFDLRQETGPNPMSLADIREAAVRSQFPSREALTGWLSRAIGEHWTHLELSLHHAYKAVSLGPLVGRAYIYLADMAFLRGDNGNWQQRCIEQALRVRPNDGAVLYAAANQAILHGDVPQWMEYLRCAFRASRWQQQQIIADLTAAATTENLPQVVDSIICELQPDLWALRRLHTACNQRCPTEKLVPLIKRRAELAQIEAERLAGPKAVELWLEAQRLLTQLNDKTAALRCAQKAVQSDPGSYEARYCLAVSLMSEGMYGEAEPQLRWCLQRKPGNPNLQAQLKEAIKGQLNNRRQAAADGNQRR